MIVTTEKVLVYLTWKDQLLTFTQPRFPDAGRQVVAGTMEANETPADAALRELFEESGLENSEVVRILGTFHYSMAEFGRNEIQHRHVVHAKVRDSIRLASTWAHSERHPASGISPIEFEFQWFPLFGPDVNLIAGHGFFVPMLKHFMHRGLEV